MFYIRRALNNTRQWFKGKNSRSPTVSIIICSIDPDKFARVTANYRQLFQQDSIEIIGIHDARSLCEGYNRAVRQARGETLILSHDDIQILTPDFGQRLRSHLSTFDIIGVAGTKRVVGGAWFLAGHPYDFQLVTSPHPGRDELAIVIRGGGETVISEIQALDGLFLACRREIASSIRFDEETFDHFHGYDIDFTFRAFLDGYRLAVCRDLFLIHYSHGQFNDDWNRYRARFETKFAAKLEPHWRALPSHIRSYLLNPKILSDPVAVGRLCDVANIAAMIASVDRKNEA